MTLKLTPGAAGTYHLCGCFCCPWALSWRETVIHFIPVIGLFTSGAAWRKRDCKILSLETSRKAPPVARKTVRSAPSSPFPGHSSPVALSPNSQRGATLLRDDDESDSDGGVRTVPTSPTNELSENLVSEDPEVSDSEEEEKVLLTSQKANTAFLFWTNFFISTTIGTTCYILQRYTKL